MVGVDHKYLCNEASKSANRSGEARCSFTSRSSGASMIFADICLYCHLNRGI